MTTLKAMQLYFKILISLLLSSFTAVSLANPAIQPYTADYRFYYGGNDVGGAVISLSKQTGDAWLLHAETTPEGLAALIQSGTLIEDTQFVLHDGQIRPLYYKSETHDTKLTFRGRESTVELEEQINFAWDNEPPTLNYFYEGSNKTLELPVGAVTRQALNLALSHHFAAQGEISVGDEVTLEFPDRQNMKRYTFVVQRQETLGTEAGRFDSYYVERDDGKRITAFWLAPELNYQAIRFEKYKRGETKISSQITSIRWEE